VNEKDMKMAPTPDAAPDDDQRPEYDLSQLKGGVRGKYLQRYRSRLHLVRLDADVASAFPSEEAVNRALRMLAELARQQAAPSNPQAN
jgi:hypothetical protein